MKVVLVNAERPDSMFLELVPETDFETAVLKILLDSPLRADQTTRMGSGTIILQIKRDRP